MDTKYMSFAYLAQTERETVTGFATTYQGFEKLMPELLDTMFRLTYFIGDQSSPKGDGVHYFALERCHRFPYSLRAAWLLTRLGYYPEAATSVRHLLESFVQLRYFTKHPELLIPHYSSPTQKGKVQFKTMFEEFSPGYYHKHYRVLASIAHAGAGLTVLSGMEEAPDGTGRMLSPIGCRFDADTASFVVNQTLELIGGYLNCLPDWFSNYRGLVDEDSETRRTEGLQDLAVWRNGLGVVVPKVQPWLRLSELLMDLPKEARA